MTSTSAFLADRLSELDADDLATVAARAGVDLGTARRACAGEYIRAADALALFAARGYDPVTRKLVAPRQLCGPLDHRIVGMGVFMQMQLQKHTVRAAAQAMDTSPSSVTRVTAGTPVSINIIVKACIYVGIHPFEQCEPQRAAA